MFHRPSDVGNGFDREGEVEVFRIERFGSGLEDERVRTGGFGERGVGGRVEVEGDLGGE